MFKSLMVSMKVTPNAQMRKPMLKEDDVKRVEDCEPLYQELAVHPSVFKMIQETSTANRHHRKLLKEARDHTQICSCQLNLKMMEL